MFWNWTLNCSMKGQQREEREMRLKCDLEDQNERVDHHITLLCHETNETVLQLKIVNPTVYLNIAPQMQPCMMDADIRTAVRTIAARVSNQGIWWSSTDPRRNLLWRMR